MVRTETNIPELTIGQEFKNPRDFLGCFRESLEYKNASDGFFEGKKPAKDVSEEEMTEVFEKDETARKALVNFSKNTGNALKYFPENYSKPFIENANDYFSCIVDYEKERYKDAEALKIYDTLRNRYHNNAAESLMRELGVSHILARGVVQLMAIQKGLETFDSAGQDERKRLKAMYN